MDDILPQAWKEMKSCSQEGKKMQINVDDGEKAQDMLNVKNSLKRQFTFSFWSLTGSGILSDIALFIDSFLRIMVN